MNKALLLSFIFVAVISSAFAFSNNSSGYYSTGIIVGGANNNNSSGYYSSFIIAEQPIGQGTTNGYYSYVGFYPLLNITYYVPFGAGLFVFHCNPSDVELDDSIICTGNLLDVNGTAVNNAHIDWELFSTNGTSFGTGVFTFVGNGAYKFSIPITVAGNFTTGDYYFKFTAGGFNTDYLFPIHLSIGLSQDDLLSIFAMIIIILSIATVIFGYWKRFMGFVVFGAFAMILVAMLMLEEQQMFGTIVSNTFAVVFSLLGFFFLISLFLQRWKERKVEKEGRNRIIDTEEEDDE